MTDSINNGPTNVVDNGNTNNKSSDDGSNSKLNCRGKSRSQSDASQPVLEVHLQKRQTSYAQKCKC